MFELTVLGSSSATPAYGRHPTAQLLNINDRYYLIDCGEGTQMQLNRYKIKWNRIDTIFISHLHGDHYLGLMGLVSTMHLNGRSKPLFIYGPPHLKELIIMHLTASGTVLNYELHIETISALQPYLIFENEDITVHTIVLSHRIHCTGFVFKEKPKKRKLNLDAIVAHNVDGAYYQALKAGLDYSNPNTGAVVPNATLTFDPKTPRSYAFCSDTIYLESIIPNIKNVNLLYHEATFTHDMLERAQQTFHTTALQAAEIAKKAEVKKLLIGHFSSRYANTEAHHAEALTVFEETMVAEEGRKYSIE